MIDRLKSITPTNGKRTEIVPESSMDEGVITSDQAIVVTRSNAGIVENSTTTKRSVERRNARRADNLQITQQIPTTVTVEECL